MRAIARSSQGQEGLACFFATLLFGFAAFAQNETPPKTTPVDGVVASATEEAAESATDVVSEVERQAEGDADPGEDLAPETSEPNAEPPPNIDEIVVRGEAGGMLVKDNTISAMAFDAGELQVEGIRDIRDLSNFTPSLEIKSVFAASNPTIFIRGVGLDDFNANAASAVAVYQDGVYMQSPAGQLFQFYDVESVEVLRGPQGTLYRNASAGAILLRSRPPEEEFAGSVTSSYGNYELWEVEGFVGGPVIPEILSGRLSGTWAIRDGITENRCAPLAHVPASEISTHPVKPPCNQTTGGAPGVPQVRFVDPDLEGRTNDIDYWAARGQLLLNAPIGQGETEWLLNVHGGQNRSRAFQYQNRFADLDGDPFAGDYNIDGPENIDLWGANLQGTWLFGSEDRYELRSLTAYEWHDLFRLENTDGVSRYVLETTYTSSAWQLSEQLELRGPIRESKYGGGDWTLGVYYLKDELDVSNFIDREGRANLHQTYTQELWNFAVYGQGEYRIRPGCERISCNFTLLAGLRYNWEHKSFDTTVVESPAGRQIRSSLDDEEDALWDDWSGDFSLAWNYSDDSNLYIKYSKGWKGGHFNGGAVSIFDIITGVDPEIVDSYEGGLRSSWFDNRLDLNLTGFYYDYLNLQVFITEQTSLGYPIPKLANATDAWVYGVELDMQAEPIDGLRITLNAAWVESEYKEFVVTFSERFVIPWQRGQRRPDPPFIIIPRKFDYSGNTLIASPNWSATGSIEYDIPLPGQVAGRSLGTLTSRFSFSWKDEMLYDACGGRGNRCNFREGFFGQKSFWIFNAAFTWTSKDEMLTLTGWVHNLLDEHYKTQSLDRSRGLGIVLDAYANPRTYGMTASFAF